MIRFDQVKVFIAFRSHSGCRVWGFESSYSVKSRMPPQPYWSHTNSLFLSPTGSETWGLIHTPTRHSTVNIASVHENSCWASVFVTIIDLISLQASFFGAFYLSKVRGYQGQGNDWSPCSRKQYSSGFNITVVLLWYGTELLLNVDQYQCLMPV